MQKARLPSNSEIADILERVADLLKAQDADTFRIRAYYRAAKTVRESDKAISLLAGSEDSADLEALPNIGKSIAASIREFVNNGRLFMLERLEGQISPEALFTTVPGIGEQLAQKIHEHLKIDTLEELELAANDGRLDEISGLGERRVKAIRDILASMLGRSTRRRARYFQVRQQTKSVSIYSFNQPSVGLLLDIDEEYREKAKNDKLKKIAPKRFNPTGEAWMPVWHTDKGGWSFSVLYSNTARAHQLRKTRDWVMIFFERDGEENQCTVVTEQQGELKDRRVVRGREKECMSYYAQKTT